MTKCKKRRYRGRRRVCYECKSKKPTLKTSPEINLIKIRKQNFTDAKIIQRIGKYKKFEELNLIEKKVMMITSRKYKKLLKIYILNQETLNNSKRLGRERHNEKMR
ncbi:hypothetical protein SLOPH_2492 [Spraguea lophii 42_110]|uniref:Uncharacterized protein n=1 Tax=Spraguea lophii (strain 42_110) TaxID=1358809 RepID=S7WAH9_SPRLO|nr:hypothetical protein SLOPH_2492 [Spraguea lophii 42_110]